MASFTSIQCVSSLDPNDGGPPRSVTGLAGALSRHAGTRILAPSRVGQAYMPVPEDVEWLNPLKNGQTKCRKKTIRDLLALSAREENRIVIHSHGIWLPFDHAVAAVSRQLDLPRVVSPRGMLEPWALNNNKWKKKLAWLLYQQKDLGRATAFHATAMTEAESIRRLGFKQPIAVLPNGIELPEIGEDGGLGAERGERDVKAGPAGFEPNSSDPSPSLPTLRPSSKKRTALFLSRIHPKKGLLNLLDAWAEINPSDWRLVIAGNDDGNHVEQLKARIGRHGMQASVEIAGPLFDEAKEAAYRNADLFVLPSYSENFGIVVAEALGYNVPVLTTTGCPWHELETHGCGWWVEPTSKAVEAGLREALGAGSFELREMGLRGRALVEANYQWPGIAERMLAFYDWILNGGKQPDFVV
ncbi:MAG TPA: glycosyltransferase [Opitutales bacterium]|nr:glycosyltransferase [Opitutales bacterium]